MVSGGSATVTIYTSGEPLDKALSMACVLFVDRLLGEYDAIMGCQHKGIVIERASHPKAILGQPLHALPMAFHALKN